MIFRSFFLSLPFLLSGYFAICLFCFLFSALSRILPIYRYKFITFIFLNPQHCHVSPCDRFLLFRLGSISAWRGLASIWLAFEFVLREIRLRRLGIACNGRTAVIGRCWQRARDARKKLRSDLSGGPHSEFAAVSLSSGVRHTRALIGR